MALHIGKTGSDIYFSGGVQWTHNLLCRAPAVAGWTGIVHLRLFWLLSCKKKLIEVEFQQKNRKMFSGLWPKIYGTHVGHLKMSHVWQILEFTPPRNRTWHSKKRNWRCISYQKWWCSIVMLVLWGCSWWFPRLSTWKHLQKMRRHIQGNLSASFGMTNFSELWWEDREEYL